ncbi:MAG: DUF6600 domain-containing protein [Mesorhizobium sp.]
MNGFSIRSIGRSGCLTALAAALAMGGIAGGALLVPKGHVAAAAVISTTVRERLSNYGAWRTSRRFGEVWVPSVARDWRPYTDGRWVWTDDGWYWQSEEPFGAIVFHYGHWVYDDDLGWVWIAGEDWAPAWVVWRESDDDIGWAPAPPPDFEVVVADAWWAFAPVAAIGAVNIVRDVLPVEENVTIVRNTTIIDKTTIINNYGNRQSVHVGNTVVPVNAGPPLARLPKTVLASLKAAKVAPPAKGRMVAAHLDTAHGALIKRQAMKLQAANLPGNRAGKEAGAQGGANPAPAGKQAAMTQAKPLPAHKATASAARMKRAPGNGEQFANARTRTAKAAPARHVVPHQAAANRMVANRQAARSQALDMRMARMQRVHMAHMDRQMARMSNRHAGPARMQRKPPKCNPHAGGCSRHG